MTFSGKTCLKIISKVTKKTRFLPLLKRYSFRKTTGGDQIETPSRFRVNLEISNKPRKLSNIPAIKWISNLFLNNFKLWLFLPNAQVHLTFHKKYEEKLLLFLLNYLTVLLFYLIVWKFSDEDIGICASKIAFYDHVILLKSRNVKFNVTQTKEKYLLFQAQEHDY